MANAKDIYTMLRRIREDSLKGNRNKENTRPTDILIL